MNRQQNTFHDVVVASWQGGGAGGLKNPINQYEAFGSSFRGLRSMLLWSWTEKLPWGQGENANKCQQWLKSIAVSRDYGLLSFCAHQQLCDMF